MLAAADAVAKMQTLSEERAARVISLIEDLAELEAREEAEDLAAARQALADGEAPVAWESVKCAWMPYTVSLKPRVEKYLDAIRDARLYRRLRDAISGLAADP